MKPKNICFTLVLIALVSPTSAYGSPKNLAKTNTNSQPAQISKSTKNFVTKFRPPNQSQPKYTIGGAVRGNNCPIHSNNNNEITALVPEKDQSLTLQDHPSFFAYISPMKNEQQATLVVKDETEDYYYSQKLMIPVQGGILKMTLAEDAPPLKVGQNYTWFLRIHCNGNLAPEDPQISANISRIKGDIPSLSQDESMLFYANSQIWYDALNSAFELSKSGNNIYWSQLLNNIGMSSN